MESDLEKVFLYSMMDHTTKEIGRMITCVDMEGWSSLNHFMKEILEMGLHMEKVIIKILKNLIQENGETILDMELDNKNLKVKRENMSEASPVINIKAEENYLMNSLHTKDNLRQAYSMVKVWLNIKMDKYLKDHSSKI